MSLAAGAVFMTVVIIATLLAESVRTLYYRKVSEKEKAKDIMDLMKSLGFNEDKPEESEEDSRRTEVFRASRRRAKINILQNKTAGNPGVPALSRCGVISFLEDVLIHSFSSSIQHLLPTRPGD